LSSGKKKRDTVEDLTDLLLGILFFVDVALFIVLALVNVENNFKLLIIAVYAMITLPIFYLGFLWYYKRTEFTKEDLLSLKKSPNYRLDRILVYLIPLIFSIIIINYVSIAVNNQSIFETLNTSLYYRFHNNPL
jgi:membrane protease YdiL (CAAX protease family)